MERRIYGIGETVLDIIFKDGQPRAAKPGGSVLNSIVSIGRMNLPVSFISEYGKDDVGELINTFLIENGVDTSFVHRFSDGTTALALAFLNDNNDARYTFYKNFPKERLNVTFPEVTGADLVQCGSFYAILPEIRDKFRTFIEKAVNNGAFILYDPNFRNSHISELEDLRPFIIENFEMASLIRGSDEDFRTIFGASNADEAYEIVRNYCDCLVYTANVDGVYVRTRTVSARFPVKKIDPVSTIGAGDNFNAGMITAIIKNNYMKKDLPKLGEKEWEPIVKTGVDFATHVCMSYENYISQTFATEMKNQNTE
jgi:fructokinase